MRITWIVLGMVFLFIWFKRRGEQTEGRHRFRVRELEHRIGELEERLCPCQSHDWKRVDYDFAGVGLAIPTNAPAVGRSNGHTRFYPICVEKQSKVTFVKSSDLY